MYKYEFILTLTKQLFTISCHEVGWHRTRIILDSLAADNMWSMFFQLLPENRRQSECSSYSSTDLPSEPSLLSTCCVNFLWCFFLTCHWGLSPPLQLCLIFFYFFVFIVGVLSWKLTQYQVIWELGSYTDDKPLRLIKYIMSSWVWFPAFFIYLERRYR